MTVLEEVAKLIVRLTPEPICDDCVADTLKLSARQHANHKTRELAGSNGFERSRRACSMCGVEKVSIRHLSK